MYSTHRTTVKIWVLIAVAPCLLVTLSVQASSDFFQSIQTEGNKLPTDFVNSLHITRHVGLSSSAQTLVQWVMQTNDHQGKPFVVVDKIHAKVFVFSHHGHLLGQASVLLGLTRGDDGVLGSGDLPLSEIRPDDRITPAGRFVSEWGRNASGQMVLWVDYEQAISMHAIRSLNAQERRLERLASSTAVDNRISYGCINVSLLFWRSVVLPTFKGIQGIVYVMPDSRTLASVFQGLALENETATGK